MHRSIGKDGDTLVSELSGDADESVQVRLKERHDEFYQQSAHLLTPLPGAQDLLRGVAAEGLQVVLATSAPEHELAMLRMVLDCDDVVSDVTTSKDVDTAKPEPDIVEIALERAGVDAGSAVFVGDAVWDCQAAARAEVASIGLLSGGVSRAELRDAGASAVFENARDLLEGLHSTRIGALISRRE